jgi:hypothetical protein
MTDDWTIIDSGGGEQLKLGEERAVVRARLGDFRVFRRTADAPETDHFVDRGLQVTYDAEERVEFIEVTAPANPVLNGVRLLQRPIADVASDLRARGIACHEERGGAYLPAYRIGLFAIGGIVEGVAINE